MVYSVGIIDHMTQSLIVFENCCCINKNIRTNANESDFSQNKDVVCAKASTNVQGMKD
jgi:hypothetical protein